MVSLEGSWGTREDGDPRGVRFGRGETGGDRRMPLLDKRGEIGGDIVRDRKGGMLTSGSGEAGPSSNGESSRGASCIEMDALA